MMTGAELRALRQRLGWTQEQLGAAVNKTDRTVHRWESGAIAVPDLVARIVSGFATGASMRKAFAPAKKPKKRG